MKSYKIPKFLKYVIPSLEFTLVKCGLGLNMLEIVKHFTTMAVEIIETDTSYEYELTNKT